LPASLEESAKLEGANDAQILMRIIIPLSKPIMAAVALYYAVGRWNSYFWEMLLLSSNKKISCSGIIAENHYIQPVGSGYCKSSD
jgi:putative aldouronate transport system permease protein